MHKKTWATEASALITVIVAIYQGHKVGVINPELIGQMFMHSYEIAMIAIPASIAFIRKIYTKYFRKPKFIVWSGPVNENLWQNAHPSHSNIVEHARKVAAKDREDRKNASPK